MATVRVPEPRIIKTYEWDALPPKEPITLAGKFTETLFHHTAGHHGEISNPRNESYTELVRYAREIQHFHMFAPDHEWIDSGHNYMVGRNGLILVGRHKSYTQCRIGEMVVSAHCPGHNRSPGVEVEHDGQERMTDAQFHSVCWLYAWLHDRAGINGVKIFPHKQFFATSCPGALLPELPEVRETVRDIRSGKVRL